MGRFKALFPRLHPTLHGLAGAWRDAANIRAYVDAARQSAYGNMAVFDDWAQWALAEADRIDPMVSGRFMAGYEHRESE